MSLYLPKDIAHYIQGFMDDSTFFSSMYISTSFLIKNPVDRVFNYVNQQYQLPPWVTRIKLGDNIVDKNLKKCKQLVELDIGRSKINTQTVKNLENIKILKLGWSKISKNALDKMQNLEHLEIQNATKSFGICFYGKSLKYLDLGNTTDSKYLYWFQYLENIEHLSLCNLSTCKSYSKLTYLDIQYCTFDLNEISHLPLETLHINSLIEGFVHNQVCIPTLKHLIKHDNYNSTVLWNVVGTKDMIVENIRFGEMCGKL